MWTTIYIFKIWQHSCKENSGWFTTFLPNCVNWLEFNHNTESECAQLMGQSQYYEGSLCYRVILNECIIKNNIIIDRFDPVLITIRVLRQFSKHPCWFRPSMSSTSSRWFIFPGAYRKREFVEGSFIIFFLITPERSPQLLFFSHYFIQIITNITELQSSLYNNRPFVSIQQNLKHWDMAPTVLSLLLEKFIRDMQVHTTGTIIPTINQRI